MGIGPLRGWSAEVMHADMLRRSDQNPHPIPRDDPPSVVTNVLDARVGVLRNHGGRRNIRPVIAAGRENRNRDLERFTSFPLFTPSLTGASFAGQGAIGWLKA